MIRSSFTRYRPGDSAPTVTISPSWLLIFDRATPLFSGQELVRINSGYIDCKRGEDVRRLDFLRDIATNRLYQVVQISDFPAKRRAFVAEISSPIPDDFENGVFEHWWTVETAGLSVFDINVETGTIELTVGPTATNPKDGSSFFWEDLPGEFDIWSSVQTDVGAVGAVRYALIGVKTDDDEGCCVGIKNDGSPSFVRLDFTSSSVDEYPISAPAVVGYVRIARVGGKFFTYYSTSLTEPRSKHEWIEIPAKTSSLFTTAILPYVGLIGYWTSNGIGNTCSWHFLRNWRATL